MPGYQLIEQKYLFQIPKKDGIRRNSSRIGFLDFLREIEQEDFPYNEHSSLIVVGLEDVLLFSRPKMIEQAREIRRLLQRAAGNFERYNCGWVQIMFRNSLVRGENLIVRHVIGELPIYLIFGSPIAEEDSGNVFYRSSFNLSG